MLFGLTSDVAVRSALLAFETQILIVQRTVGVDVRKAVADGMSVENAIGTDLYSGMRNPSYRTL